MLAAGLWLRGPGESSSWVSKVPLANPSKPQFSALFRSLFARRATALGSSGGRPCFGCEALASLLSGFRRYRYKAPSERPCSVPFPSLFARRATALGGGAPWLAAPWPCLSCSCACCRALATRPWRVVLMGFEGTVRHPASLNFRLFFGPFLHAVPLRLGLAEGAVAGCALAVP